MNKLFLTRRNLLTLLSKLDRKKNGEDTQCTILKNDTTHPEYPATAACMVTVVEDEVYYTSRPPGEVHPKDLANLIKR